MVFIQLNVSLIVFLCFFRAYLFSPRYLQSFLMLLRQVLFSFESICFSSVSLLYFVRAVIDVCFVYSFSLIDQLLLRPFLFSSSDSLYFENLALSSSLRFWHLLRHAFLFLPFLFFLSAHESCASSSLSFSSAFALSSFSAVILTPCSST